MLRAIIVTTIVTWFVWAYKLVRMAIGFFTGYDLAKALSDYRKQVEAAPAPAPAPKK